MFVTLQPEAVADNRVNEANIHGKPDRDEATVLEDVMIGCLNTK